MGTLTLFLLLALTTPFTLADTGKCKAGCGKSTPKAFKYEEGTTYVYKVEGKTVTSISNAQGDPATLSVQATAELSVQPDCAHFLKLKDIVVKSSDGKEHKASPGTDEHPLRFNFHDGHIDSEICSAEQDSNQGLNIKRALASLFQVGANVQGVGSTVHQETDVFGTCPTEFTFSKDGAILKVRKTRNLNRCANREHFVSNLLAVPYNGEGSIQATPFQASSLDVQQVIKDGLLSSAESNEEYFYRPLSNREAGAKTVVTTKITLITSSKAPPSKTNVNKQRSIIFDPPHIRPTPGNLENINAAIKAAHDSMHETVGPTSAQDFAQLVYVLRQSTKEDILKAYEQAHHKKMVQDALLATKTGDAIEVAVELNKKKELTPLQTRLWSLSLNVVRHATPGSLAAIASVLDTPEASRYTWLGAGALAGRYCREHECSTSVTELNTLLSKIAAPITSGCKPKNKEGENKIILSLKSLRNARFLGQNADAVASCASDSSIPARVRVAALEAFLAESCSSKLRKTALAILKNVEEDSEIRIKAYLAIVDCPSSEVATAIKDLIENEPSNQVGAFIVSHLRNIRASANPEKESARRYLGSFKPRKRFPNDLRKFSRNLEISGLLDIVNVGANAESNIIYSQRSFLPRSVNLNLTTDVFGQSINLLEIGLRTENLDRSLEHIFGPKGIIKNRETTEPTEQYSRLKDRWAQLTDKVKGRFSQAYRGKRSVSQSQINDVSKKVQLGPNQIDGELEVDLSLKLFGAEGIWSSVHGGKRIDADSVVDKVFDKLDAGINKAKSFDHDIRTHAHFLETEFIYPTGLGIPLKLATNGDSAIHLILKGQVDVQSIAKDPLNANAKLHIQPSAAIDINGLILIDAGVLATGVKVTSSIHTSTGADITIKALDGQGIDVNVDLPQAKSDIITLKTEVVTFSKPRGEKSTKKPLTFNTKRREYQGCFDQLSPLTGLTFCAEIGYPLEKPSSGSALFPLNGPAKISIRAEKDDPTLTGYHFKALYDRKNPDKRSLELLVETPNSKNDRRLSLIAEATKKPELGLKVALTSPWKKASIEGQIVDNDKGQLIVGKLTNDKKQYTVKVGLDVTGNPDSRTYSPVLEYSAGGKKESIKDAKSPVQIQGTVTISKIGDSGRSYKFNALTLTTPAGAFSADGTLTREKGKVATDLKLAHDKQSLTIVSKLERLGDHHYKINIQAVPAQYPDFGFNLNWERLRQPGQIKHDLVLVHGPNLKSDTSRLAISNDVKYKYESVSSFDGSISSKVSYPVLGIDVALDGAASRNSLSYNLQATYDKKKLDSKLSAKANIKALRDYELLFHAKLNNKGVTIESRREKPDSESSKLYHKLELTPGGKYELASNINAKLEKSNIKYKSDHTLKLNGQPDIKVDNALAWTPGHLDTHCVVLYGDAKYVDTLVKLDRSPGKVDGKFRAVLKDYLDSNGEVKYTGGKGTANLLIDIPKVQRKIQGKGDVTVAGSKHKANVELLWNADKDPSQKLVVNTDTDLTANSVDSKNTIKVLEWTTEINTKGTRAGTPRDGTISCELDLSLPSGRKISIKHKRENHIRQTGEKSDGNVEWIVAESKGADTHTATLKAAAKDVEYTKGLYDAHGEVTYKSSVGTDLALSLSGSNKLKGEDHYVTDAKGDLKASFLSKPANFKWNSEATINSATYSLTGQSTCGTVFDIRGEAKATPEERHSSTNIDLKLPFEKLSVLKLKSDWVLKSPVGSPCEVGAKNLANLLEKMKSTQSLKLASTISKLAPNLLPSCEGKTVNELTLNDKVTKLEAVAKADLRRGAAKVNLVLPNDKPRSLTSTWVQELDNDIPKISTSVKANWDGNKEVKVEFKGEGNKALNDIKVNLGASSHIEETHKAEVNVHHKRKGEKAIDTEVEVIIDDKFLKVGVDVNADPKHPRLDIKAKHAAGESRIYTKIDRKSPHEYEAEGETKWTSDGGGSVQWKSKAVREGPDAYKVSWSVNSAKFNLDHHEGLIAVNIPNKKVDIDVKDAKGNIISGSGTYQMNVEGDRIAIEGSGNVKVKDQAHAATFSTLSDQLTLGKDKEIGLLQTVDVKLDGKEFVNIERKDTNKQIRRLLKACYKDKCIHYEIDSKIKVSDFFEHNHELVVIYDYRGVGVPTTVNLKATNVRKGSIVDHDAELRIGGPKEVTIKSKAYIHEKDAGIILTLPKRTIEALASLDIPKSKNAIKAEATLWLDKVRNPSLKTSATLVADVDKTPDGASVSGEARLVHPGVKDISVKGHLAVATKNTILDASADVDIFGDANQKVTLEAKINANEITGGRNVTYVLGAQSKGKNLDAEVKGNVAISSEAVSAGQWISYIDSTNRPRLAGASLEISKNKFLALIKLPDQVLVNIQTDLKVSRDAQVVDGTIELVGLKPIGIHSEVKDFNSYTGSIYRKDDPNKKLSLKGGFAWGQVAEIRATKKNGDEKIDLCHLTVALDESHFLQTDYGGSLDAIKKIIEDARKDGTIFVREAKIAVADSVLEANKEIKAIGEQLQKSQPTAKPILSAYQTELKAIADELADEKLAKEVTEIIKTGTKLATEILQKLSEVAQKYREILENLSNQISQVVKQWVPKISARLSQLAEAVTTAVDTLVQAAASYGVKLIESIRQHEAEIKRVATVVGQAIQDIGRIVSKAVTQIRHEIESFVEVISEQLKALPLSQLIKERYSELKSQRVPEQALRIIKEVLETVAATLPTPELSELITVVTNYAEKRVKNEKVDDIEEIKEISKHAISAFKSIIKLLRSQLTPEDIDKIIDLTMVPLPGSAWFSLPILSPVHLSPLKWLRSGDLPTLSEYYYTYRPTLNPLDWIPPYKAYGFLIRSHNFYTFNRKYYHFEGSCSYVLAQDFVDGNFSLIANLNGGKLKSIQLSDPTNSFEILADRSLLVNGKPHEYPALEGDLAAWRRYDNVNIRTKAGVFVTCDNKRDICQFHISGFYHGKTRGLLGTNNYEPYTDFTLPNGKITTKSNEFGNAWGIGSCAPQAEVEHEHEKEPSVSECNNIFTGSTPLTPCFPYVNPAPYLAACNHLANEVKEDKKKVACDLAFSYAQACLYDRVKVEIPHSCASCSVGSAPLAVDDVVSVKNPQKKADIILVVEQITPNEEVFKELIAPLVETLSSDLKEKGVADVHFSLLGFGAPDQKWPTHFGVESQSSGFAGKTKNIWFGAPSTIEQPLDTPIKKLKWAKHQLDLETGNIRLVDALNEASEFPFRPDAVKTIIGVVGQKCENSLLPISLQTIRSFLRTKSLRDHGIALHIVTPLDDLTANGSPATNVVAFDEEAAYTLADAGKKPIVGDSELSGNLRFDTDPCTKVALRSFGSVVNSKNFLAAKGGARKQFIDVVSQRVTKGLVGDETEQECRCILAEGLYPRTSCKIVSRRQKRDVRG